MCGRFYSLSLKVEVFQPSLLLPLGRGQGCGGQEAAFRKSLKDGEEKPRQQSDGVEGPKNPDPAELSPWARGQETANQPLSDLGEVAANEDNLP